MTRLLVARSSVAAALALAPICAACGSSPAPASGGHEATAFSAEQSDSECEPDVTRLFAGADPETIAPHHTSDAEFRSRWLASVRCHAELGDAESQLALGVAYRDGSDGPPQDYFVAAQWFRRAAEQANPMAQYNLGQLYQSGRGVPKDLVQAHLWYNLAASGFDWRASTRELAFARRNTLESQMTSAQVREAQRLASEWWDQRNR